jgi:hypothetical protein
LSIGVSALQQSTDYYLSRAVREAGTIDHGWRQRGPIIAPNIRDCEDASCMWEGKIKTKRLKCRVCGAVFQVL